MKNKIKCHLGKRSISFIIGYLFLVIYTSFFLVSCDRGKIESSLLEKNHDSKAFIKAVHYFSSSWPKTFWQEFEYGQVKKDFDEIKENGFNTVILVVPWRGFEIDFSGATTTSDPRMYERLTYLLSEIKNRNLNYMLRLGYPYNYAEGVGIGLVELCTAMYTDENVQNKWLDYLNKISAVTKNFKENSAGVLVSWEDFWCPHFIFTELDEKHRLELSQSMGYASWMSEKEDSLLRVILGKNKIEKRKISIPTKNDLDYIYYIEYVDDFFNKNILGPAKGVFSNAAMEIRVDKEPAKSAKERLWVEHSLHLTDENHRGTYWAPSWGAENNGETLPLEKALFNFEYFLKHVSNNGESKNHVIEQFNFTDNTPYFPNNAVIAENAIDDFLLASVPLLKKYASGYGLWTYKDYADNVLFNASFEFGLEGWQHEGEVEVVKEKLDSQLKMTKGSFIVQNVNVHEKLMLPAMAENLNLCIFSPTGGGVSLYVGDTSFFTKILIKGNNCLVLRIPPLENGAVEFKLVANQDLVIDELKLYGFVQRLGVYDEFGGAGAYLESVLSINSMLERR